MATSNRKGKLGCISVIIVIVGFLIIQAWGDYHWEDKASASLVSTGWLIVDRQANLVDFTHPWTVVKAPVVRIALINPDSVVTVKDSLKVVNIIWIEHQDLDETIAAAYPMIYNCYLHQNALVDTNATAKDLVWRINEYPVDINVSSILCK